MKSIITKKQFSSDDDAFHTVSEYAAFTRRERLAINKIDRQRSMDNELLD